MDNNLPEAILKEKKNFSILLLLIIAIASLFVGWYYLNSVRDDATSIKNTDVVNSTEGEVQTINANATVKSVDYDNNEITVNLYQSEFSMGEAINFDSGDKKITLAPNTVIQKLIISKDNKGSVIRSENIEIDLLNLKAGDILNIVFNGRSNDVLLNNVLSISNIIIVNDNNFIETIAKESGEVVNDSMSYIKGKVVSLDNVSSKIEYIPYLFNQAGTEKLTITLGDNTDIFSIDDENRYNIKHAKKEINISNVKVGDDVFFGINPEASFGSSNTVAREVILITKQ